MIAKIHSLPNLRFRAGRDPRYAKLAVLAAQNLGGSAKTLDEAMRWLSISASESGDEQGVVEEINFCRDLIRD